MSDEELRAMFEQKKAEQQRRMEQMQKAEPPAEPQGRKRKVQLNVRLTEEEAERLRKKVEQSGLTQREYILKCILGKEVRNTDGIKEVLPELKRQGNNLNQIAKKLNEQGYVDYRQELPNTMKEVREVWQSLKQFLQEQE